MNDRHLRGQYMPDLTARQLLHGRVAFLKGRDAHGTSENPPFGWEKAQWVTPHTFSVRQLDTTLLHQDRCEETLNDHHAMKGYYNTKWVDQAGSKVTGTGLKAL